MNYKIVLGVIFLGILFYVNGQSRDWRVQRLNQFQDKYNNSKADIIFLIDVSGSVSNAGFNTEKEFIKSILSKISVQAIASRVAVATFGKYVRKELDYIDYRFLDKDKCTFSKEFYSKVKHRKGIATNMNGALDQALRILDGAVKNRNKRPNVNTVVFLLTDGHWNYGGSPYSKARSLRDRNNFDAEIFSIGVGRVLRSQLKLISGLDSNVIIAKDFSDFEGLATRIRGDQVEKLYKQVIPSLCGVTCDYRAECTCGTVSGIYTCACQPGYYGSGLPGRCYECLRGTYKTFASPDPCKPCPAKSTTKQTGSKSIRDCVCFPGYSGYPHLGQPCSPVQCPKLPSSIFNGKVSACGKYYKETCTFSCDLNHHIANEKSSSRKLTCQIDGKWSRQVPQCVETRCQWPPNPPHMKLKCDGDSVGDKCLYTCEKGYTLVGSNQRECKPDGQWSHSLPHCEIITCAPLPKIQNVNINPSKCLTQATKFNDGCAQSCKPGFKFVSGDQKRVCNHDGTWSGTELDCRDLTPPTINCPESIIAETEPGLSYKEITYNQPTVTDNSITGRDDIVILQEPLTIQSPHEFPIGTTLLNFTAIDNAGNSDSCTFRVEIKDREDPKFTYCPNDIPTYTSSPGDKSKKVEWTKPLFSDNSGKVSLIYTSHNNPSVFPVGPSNVVVYTIEDSSNNRATCEFVVKVEPKSCPAREPPINGAVACNFASGFGHLCSVSCQNPYTFNGPLAYQYVCAVSGNWMTIPPSLPNMWPDCTAMQLQEGMGQNMRFFYFSGSCHESIDARNEIANNFVKILDRILRNEGGCSNAANARVCQADNVQIKCGRVQGSSYRNKRSTKKIISIDVEVEVLSKEDASTQKKVVQNVAENVRQIKDKSTSLANQIKVLHVAGDTMILESVKTVGSITGVCLKGMVFDKVEKNHNGKIKTEQTCVSCLAGSYFSIIEKKCIQCPKGTYSENPGSLGCAKCPVGTTTLSSGATNHTKCKEPCDPGWFSVTGLQNCQACPRGEYQPKPYATSCLKCPGSTVTSEEGSTSLNQCGMLCPKGSFSKTGAEPCLPCAQGFYQSGTGSKQCLRCDKDLSTHGVGATQVSECKKINNCASSPCLNGGNCVSGFNNYTCTCTSQYKGRNCEEEKYECAENPCYGNAVCVDKIGSYRCVCPDGFSDRLCSTRAPKCKTNTCANGGVCQETPQGVSCSCKVGWTGKYCERTIHECASSPCMNGGTCLDSHRGFSCLCKNGFSGELCEENIDDCKENNQCLNGGTCVDGVEDFSCSCPLGFTGPRCNINIDDCSSNPCRNDGECIDGVNSFKCYCKPTFHGRTCEKRNTKTDFDLAFDRNVQSFAETTFRKDLSAFTISFWVKISSEDLESGTVLSYAIDNDVRTVDNELVLRDLNHLLLVVSGEEVPTNISAADDQWHHISLSWQSSGGICKAYKDGVKITENRGFHAGQAITGGGTLILGQEQDEVGRNFSASEALDGSISQFNMWDNVLSEDEILILSSYRCDEVQGNLLAWSDFYDKVSDDVKKVTEFCQVKNSRYGAWGSSSVCRGREISAQCLSYDKRSLKELNLIDATCTKNGFFCRDSDQTKYDPENKITCPKMNIRYECPYYGVRNCQADSCSYHGKCVETLGGYKCLCNDGYHGDRCEKELTCHKPMEIENGYVNYHGSTAQFSCKTGFKLSGASRLTCRQGKYDNAIPQCSDINECTTKNGNCNQRCVNTLGSFKCECHKGFKMSGNVCVDVDECLLNNGNCQDKCFNNYGSFSCGCRAGYQISPDKRSCEDKNECTSRVSGCQQNCWNTRGSFECACKPGFYINPNDKKSCLRVSCPSLQTLSHGKISQGYGSYEKKVIYECDSGYRLNGPFERICQADGQWSGRTPVCEPISCGTLSSPFNGQASRYGNGKGSYYRFSCLSGFLLVGSEKRYCESSGLWSGTQPRCIPYYCRPVNPPINGLVIGTSYIEGATLIIKCNAGFMLSDKNSNYLTCRSNRQWSTKVPSCQPVRCRMPEKIANGVISVNSVNFKSEIRYSCNEGYGLSGSPIRVCQGNSEWSGIAPTCLFNSCGYPGDVKNGEFIGDDFSFGKIVSYKCKIGYRVIGEVNRKCLLSGKWTGTKPECREISCGVPDRPQNGEVRYVQTSFDSTVIYDCLPGYSLHGERTRKCLLNGQWSGNLPTCKSGICGAKRLVGSGSIQSTNYPNSYKDNEYCRWKIIVADNKKATVLFSSVKVDISDQVEIYDGRTNNLLTILSGILAHPILITSPSNQIDVKFLSDKKDVADGFSATFAPSVCGGHLTKIGETLQTPGYPKNYPNDITCVWQINVPNQKIKLKFEYFSTYSIHDSLEVWNSINLLSYGTKIGTFYGTRGSLLEIRSSGIMYLKFTADSTRNARGFRAKIVKDTIITG